MKISALRYEMHEDCAILTVPFRGEGVRCAVDIGDLGAILRECSAVHVTEPRPGSRYLRMYSHGKQILLHRFLMGMDSSDERLVDHKNTNTLDCRKENLRPSTFSTNALNKKGARRESSTGIRGVYLNKSGTYLAHLLGRPIGNFSDIRDAVETVWLALLAIDPIAATNYLRSLPDTQLN